MNYPIFRSLILCVAILSAGQLFSQSDLIVCDKAPGEAIACLKDIGWEQPLEPVLQMSPAGTTDTTWEKSIYFILVSADFWKADSATLQLYYEIDPANNQRKLIDTYQLKVSPEWNYCWKTWTFYEPGTYSVDAYIGDKYVDFGIVMILPKPE